MTRLLFAAALVALPALLPAAENSLPLLTPKPGPEPRINGPRVYGARPGHPFIYRIPATGERPMSFGARGLPRSLRLDNATGIVTGSVPAKPGEYRIEFRARNSRGSASRPFKLVVGDKLALTPPMGWNHWYTHYNRITDSLFRQAADAMVSSGMADYGYQYVNIDDCWMAKPESKDPALAVTPRESGGTGAIVGNRNFPDMRGLTGYIHSKGLRAGIYTSPGPRTCAGYEGAWQHEEADARQFAAWGFDFLKYDWCSYGKIATGKEVADRQAPYRKMGAIVAGLDRDVVFNLCQYGMSDVWNWGAEVGGHAWRTTGDLGLEKDDRLPGFYRIGLRNAEHWRNAAPGAWNDPDYILIGYVGNAFKIDELPRRAALTAGEQYSYMAMWALMASPLIYSGDMSRLDEFTLNVLCNAEVIDVDQDPLGRQGRIARRSEDELVLAKPLEDGSIAVGLFNLSESERRMEIAFSDVDESASAGKRQVRDLWRQKDLGSFDGSFAATVPRHDVLMVRVRPAAQR
jgi:alpha-galactosidase